MVAKFTFQSVFSNSRRNLRREVARSHSSRILSFDLIGQHRNESFHVTEIVLPLGFADATTGNPSAVRRLSIQSMAEVLQEDNFVILSR